MKWNEPDIRIRFAVTDEAARLAFVLYESFVEYKSSYTDEAFAATTPASNGVLQRLNEGFVWVALLGDEIVGTVSAMLRDESLYVQSMAILPAARGRRIGELLLQNIESFAIAKGYKLLFLSTTPFLHRAIRLYENFGFRRNDAPPHDLYGTPLFSMEKSLPSSSEG